MAKQGSATNRHIVVGAGGQGRVVVETWRAMSPEAELVVVDDNSTLHGTRVEGAEVVGSVSLLAELEGDVVIALGNNETRLRLAAEWAAREVRFGRAIHPSAVISPSAVVNEGAVVLPRAVVHTGAHVGAHAIINTGVIVEHDCTIGEGASISPGACMAGRVTVERAAFVSVGATLAPRITVGAGTVVGAGAVVVSDIPPGVLALGVPAKVVRESLDGFDFARLL